MDWNWREVFSFAEAVKSFFWDLIVLGLLEEGFRWAREQYRTFEPLSCMLSSPSLTLFWLSFWDWVDLVGLLLVLVWGCR